jgi:4-carboxymuconolactone decarboxylase
MHLSLLKGISLLAFSVVGLATATPSMNTQITPQAQVNRAEWYGVPSPLAVTDPELATIIDNFALDDVQQIGKLDRKTRILITLATTIAQNTPTEFANLFRAGLHNKISPEELREVIYHAVPYVGIARVSDLLSVANKIMEEQGISLPLDAKDTVDRTTRFEQGLALQKSIFGEMITKMHETAPANQKHIQTFLSANCFGDYQTRSVFDPAMRELLTFSMLISLGGCEPQVKGHIMGNVSVGNGKDILIAATTQLLPWLGYPRTLNALACINEVIPEKN